MRIFAGFCAELHGSGESCYKPFPRSHVLRGKALADALRPTESIVFLDLAVDAERPGRAFPRRAWERDSGYAIPSLHSLYSIASTKASQLASMMFSLTPTVPQTSCSSMLSMKTRIRAAVPASEFTTRTL